MNWWLSRAYMSNFIAFLCSHFIFIVTCLLSRAIKVLSWIYPRCLNDYPASKSRMLFTIIGFMRVIYSDCCLSFSRFTHIYNSIIKAALSFKSYSSQDTRRIINLSRINPYSSCFSFQQRESASDSLLTFDHGAAMCLSVVALSSSHLLQPRYTGQTSGKAWSVKEVNAAFCSYEWQRMVAALSIISGESKGLYFNAYRECISVQTRMQALSGGVGSGGTYILRSYCHSLLCIANSYMSTCSGVSFPANSPFPRKIRNNHRMNAVDDPYSDNKKFMSVKTYMEPTDESQYMSSIQLIFS